MLPVGVGPGLLRAVVKSPIRSEASHRARDERVTQAKDVARFLHLGDSVVLHDLHDGYTEGWVGTTNFTDQTLAVSAQPSARAAPPRGDRRPATAGM